MMGVEALRLVSSDGQFTDIMVSLNENHRPTANYVRDLRRELPRQFPGTHFYFLPADITTQVLNFGLPAPTDIQFQSDKAGVSERPRR